MMAIILLHLRKRNEEEKIGDKDEAFLVAQEYANTGFQVISEWLSNLKKKDSEAIMWDLLEEMDTKYTELFQEN
jgi:hypothetical protein